MMQCWGDDDGDDENEYYVNDYGEDADDDDDDGDDDETREGSSGDHGAANTHLSRLSAPCSQPSEGNEYSLDLSFCQKAFVDICHGHLLSWFGRRP